MSTPVEVLCKVSVHGEFLFYFALNVNDKNKNILFASPGTWTSY